MEIPSSCSYFNTTLWLHHLKLKGKPGEKDQWELYKNAVCYFEQILEAAPYHLPPITQTIQVRWARQAGHCWWSKNKSISKILLWTPTHGHTNIGWPTKTLIYGFCVDTGFRLEDLQKAMTNRVWWQERVWGICC